MAFLTVPSEDKLGLSVTLNIRRALIDGTSLGVLKLDFALLYCKVLFREPTSMRDYISYIQSSQKIDNAKTF